MNYVKLYDRQGNFCGDASPDTRCWCAHTLGVHYSSHCVDGCPCGGSYPPRLPAGKQGFSQAMPKPERKTAKVDRVVEKAALERISEALSGGVIIGFVLGALTMAIVHLLGWWP